MKDGVDLVALASILAINISKDLKVDELLSVIELLGLLKHDLEAIKLSRIINKIEEKKER